MKIVVEIEYPDDTLLSANEVQTILNNSAWWSGGAKVREITPPDPDEKCPLCKCEGDIGVLDL